MAKKKRDLTPSATPLFGHPETAEQTVNRFGTYEIQPTADTENEYPAIAQGRPRKKP